MNTPRWDGAGTGPATAQENVRVTILEGDTVHRSRPASPASPASSTPLGMVQGHTESIYFDNSALSKHVLFLGGIGTGKTNAMKQLVVAIQQASAA